MKRGDCSDPDLFLASSDPDRQNRTFFTLKVRVIWANFEVLQSCGSASPWCGYGLEFLYCSQLKIGIYHHWFFQAFHGSLSIQYSILSGSILSPTAPESWLTADPDPFVDFIAESYPAFHSDVNPDPASQNDAGQDFYFNVVQFVFDYICTGTYLHRKSLKWFKSHTYLVLRVFLYLTKNSKNNRREG